ncbi:MAG TPA: tetratricopeptide repeat protein [Terriglobales bacterium]|nr:tetratricopeptide repeat protein [Terriglobales bacterium]
MRTKRAILLWVVLFPGLLPCFSQQPSPNPNHQQQIESHKRQAAEYLKQQKPDLAIPEFRAIIALDPKNVDARGNLGVLLFFQGNYTDAIPQLRAALKLQPTLWKIEALLGMGEKRTADVKAALTDLEKAFPKLEEKKLRIETGVELIEIYSGTGDLDKAASIVSVLRDLDPTNVDLLYTSYRIYSDLAGESMLSLSLVAPNSARMHQVMAHELAKQGNSAAAIAQYREALKIDPNVPGLHFELAEMLNGSSIVKEQDEAEGEYQAALSVNQFDEKSECRLGDIAFRKGNLNQAEEYYSKAIQLQPNDAEAHLGLGKTFMALNQQEKAEPPLERAVQLEPTSAVAHFRLSTLYRLMGRSADAKRELDEYQKYKTMKEKLAAIYREMREEPVKAERDDPEAQK